MIPKHINKLVDEFLIIDSESAEEAKSIGFIARALVQATIPHKKVDGNEFKRKNGNFRLTILADSDVGLPYGSIPRLLIAWLTTEAVKTKEREILLGDSLTDFMAKLDLVPTGGRWGNITRLKNQMERLFSSSISCTYDNGENWAIKNVNPVSNANLWWDPKSPEQSSLFKSTVTLGENFFDEIISSPIPIDLRVLKALKKSPMSLDIYCWLTYRASYLKKKSSIPWESLQVQFGSNYSFDNQGLRNFKKAFIRELKKVQIFYKEAQFETTNQFLVLKPSHSHINKLITL